MDIFKHVIQEHEANTRLDKCLTGLNEGYSRSQIQSWIKADLVKVNGNTVRPNYVTKIGDELTWQKKEKEVIHLLPENIPLSIIYEDEDLLVVDKQKGLVVHPSESYPKHTLVNGLLNYTNELSTLAGDYRPGIVHRLDKDTSGLLLIAKTDSAYESLVKQFKERSVIRKYKTLVHGKMKHNQGMIKAPIGRHPKRRQQMTVIAEGKEAITKFRLLEDLGDYTLLECELITGRTHQIRVHLKHISHPVVGDPLYGRKKQFTSGGQLLHAYYLSFIHPTTKREISLESPLPEYFVEVLSSIGKNA